ncbi:MAG: PQQ-binding-like beta-propeller repeat protein [Pseudomonadota bacterium]
MYRQYCATCHDNPEETRALPLASLKQLNASALRFAMTEGVMQEQAKPLGRRALATLIDYLAAKESDSDAWLAGWMCDTKGAPVDLAAGEVMPYVGIDLHSTRFISAEQAGLTSRDLGNLEFAWAIGFPDTTALRAAPVIIGDTMFYAPTPTERLLAIDVKRPCVKWVYNAGIELRTSVTYGELGRSGRHALVFADRRGQVHALDPVTGTLIWKAEGRHSAAATITGAPVLYNDLVILPVSASGVGRGANPQYECCVEHGAVVALDAATGEHRWTWHTMREATYTGKTNRLGVKLRGPSGAPIWSSPTIDARRNLVYATSGQNTSLPATETSDAVLAIDIGSGELRWGFQALANDVWIIGCRETPALSTPNCPDPKDSVLKDFDFGAAAILAVRPDGKDILLAGQKSGDVWALDPDNGKLLWNHRFGQGTPLGGVHWGMATDGQRLFVPINDPFRRRGEFAPEPGMNAIDIDTGKVLWRTATRPDCSPARKAMFADCDEKFGLSAAPLAVDDSVVAGSIDGRLYVFDGRTGEVTFEFDTLRDFTTVNGYPARGGSIDSHSVFAGAGMVFVGSGYGSFGQAPGNVLIALKPGSQ